MNRLAGSLLVVSVCLGILTIPALTIGDSLTCLDVPVQGTVVGMAHVPAKDSFILIWNGSSLMTVPQHEPEAFTVYVETGTTTHKFRVARHEYAGLREGSPATVVQHRGGVTGLVYREEIAFPSTSFP